MNEERLLWLAQSPKNKDKEKRELAAEILRYSELLQTIPTLNFKLIPGEGVDACEDCIENFEKLKPLIPRE